MRYSSKGRRNTSKLETSRVEVILCEKVEGKKKRIADQAKAADEKKKIDAAKKAEEAKAPKPIEAKPGEIKAAPDKAGAGKAPAVVESDVKISASKDDKGMKITKDTVRISPKKEENPSQAPKAVAPKPAAEEAKPKVEVKPAAKVEEKTAAPVEKPKEMEPKKEEAKPSEAKEEKKDPKKATPPKKEEKNEVA